MKPRSAIEMMVDKACGYDPSVYDPTAPAPEPVLLRCPICLATKKAARAASDLPRTVIVVFPCGKCRKNRRGRKMLPIYLDELGVRIEN